MADRVRHFSQSHDAEKADYNALMEFFEDFETFCNNYNGEGIVLYRSKNWPSRWYSKTAGGGTLDEHVQSYLAERETEKRRRRHSIGDFHSRNSSEEVLLGRTTKFLEPPASERLHRGSNYREPTPRINQIRRPNYVEFQSSQETRPVKRSPNTVVQSAQYAGEGTCSLDSLSVSRALDTVAHEHQPQTVDEFDVEEDQEPPNTVVQSAQYAEEGMDSLCQ